MAISDFNSYATYTFSINVLKLLLLVYFSICLFGRCRNYSAFVVIARTKLTGAGVELEWRSKSALIFGQVRPQGTEKSGTYQTSSTIILIPFQPRSLPVLPPSPFRKLSEIRDLRRRTCEHNILRLTIVYLSPVHGPRGASKLNTILMRFRSRLRRREVRITLCN